MKKKTKLLFGVGVNDADYTIKIVKVVGFREDGKKIQKYYGYVPFINPGWECWRDVIVKN